MNYGATQEEWDHFSNKLGLTADLLPVVSDPSIPIAPGSAMKIAGKTPSKIYGGDFDKVAGGIKGWTSIVADDQRVENWARQPAHGICIQTRLVRAFDIDIDSSVSKDIVNEIYMATGIVFPERIRANSEKRLLPFILPGDYSKRVIFTIDGAVEFLATGQQFIAAGTHTSGARYEWLGGLPEEIPEINVGLFEAIWAGLAAKFGTGQARGAGGQRNRDKGERAEDEIADYLEVELAVLEYGNDGQLFIECPWKSEHTSDSGPTETAYFPAGSRGYAEGRFVCLHAHCAGRSQEQFKTATGYSDQLFDTLSEELGATATAEVADVGLSSVEKSKRPPYLRNNVGEILPTASNLELAMADPNEIGMTIRHDEFRDEIMFAPVDEPKGYRLFSDATYFRLGAFMERKRDFRPIDYQLLRRAVHSEAERNRFDSAIEWLENEIGEWDGIPRINDFFCNYFGVEQSPYVSAVSNYFWTALAGRVLEPGCKVDMVPVLIGERQGEGKSWGIRSLVPEEAYSAISFAASDDNLARKMRGTLIGSVEELRGLNSRDLESIKAFVTETHEKWVPKFKEFTNTYARRLVFIATTNTSEFLADGTGNRRWLPMKVESKVDRDAILRDRWQLWAEARELFKKEGIAYAEAERLARNVHEDHMITDPWQIAINMWLDAEDDIAHKTTPRQRNAIYLNELMSYGLGLETRNTKRADMMRVTDILRRMGWENIVTKDKETRKSIRIWRDPKLIQSDAKKDVDDTKEAWYGLA